MKRVAVTAATAAALALPTMAGAHVVITPPFVEDGEQSLISLQIVNERPPHETTEVVTAAPPGIEIVSANAPPGWLATVQGHTVTWRHGRIRDAKVVAFPVRIVADVRAGTYAFRTEQRYDDDATVAWASDLTVLPAAGAASPNQHPWNAIAAAITGIVVIAASLIGVRFIRRRSLQEK